MLDQKMNVGKLGRLIIMMILCAYSVSCQSGDDASDQNQGKLYKNSWYVNVTVAWPDRGLGRRLLIRSHHLWSASSEVLLRYKIKIMAC